mmetsp:Transcript_40747/g.69583  ORF Transcript_40747/g.69583 Transcript_40747/m.69583 type:complete len:207 (-) Transcript_40747:1097-1717(-)
MVKLYIHTIEVQIPDITTSGTYDQNAWYSVTPMRKARTFISMTRVWSDGFIAACVIFQAIKELQPLWHFKDFIHVFLTRFFLYFHPILFSNFFFGILCERNISEDVATMLKRHFDEPFEYGIIQALHRKIRMCTPKRYFLVVFYLLNDFIKMIPGTICRQCYHICSISNVVVNQGMGLINHFYFMMRKVLTGILCIGYTIAKDLLV